MTLSRRQLLARSGAGGLAVAAATTGTTLAPGGLGLGAGVARADTAGPRGTSSEASPAYEWTTGYLRLRGSYGKFTEVAVDPTGRGHYEKPTFTQLFLSSRDAYDATFQPDVVATVAGNRFTLENINVPEAAIVQQTDHNTPVGPLRAGHTIGQSFTVTAKGFDRVAAQCPTWNTKDSGVTLTLYAGTPGATLTKVTESVFPKVGDNSWVPLTFATQPAGVYYLEASAPVGTVGWWAQDGGTGTDVGGQAYVDRTAVADRTMGIEIDGFEAAGAATWTWQADGNRISSTIAFDPPSASAGLGMTATTSWQRDGYSIAYADGVLFERFVSSDGRYMPAEQLKRHDTWDLPIGKANWLYLTGTGPYDLRIDLPDVTLGGSMTADTLQLALDRTDAKAQPSLGFGLTVLEHTDSLPLPYPAFVTSDGGRGEQLSRFFYERAYSRPYGNATDWMDWEGRILDWSDTAAPKAVRDNLLGLTVGDDGYVYSWGSQAGWPFPDPKQYDTRHFTTNAMYLLGVSRYYSWTGDQAFLEKVLPLVRKAIDFYLNDLHGSDALIRIDSRDHTGDFQSLGSNYWDISADGYLSAYENAYFYGALGAVAALERHAGDAARAARLEALQKVVRTKYNDTFWDNDAGRYIQCVDAFGQRHDYGSSYVNLEAAAWGIPTPAQAKRIFDWLEHGTITLSDEIVFIDSLAITTALQPGHTLGQAFTVDEPLSAVGIRLRNPALHGGTVTLTLYADGPGGKVLARRTFTQVWDLGWPHLDVPNQPAGRYYLEVSGSSGELGWCIGTDTPAGSQAYADGKPTTDPASRATVVIGAERTGAADIYQRWVFAPRATTRRNNFWYTFVWGGLNVPWEIQLQDGGTSLYISGFDVIARALYLGADDAWRRMTEILDRWAEPDHLSGGDPLYRGEHPQGSAAGQVGTDNPFPESGLVPASFLYAFVGVEAAPDALLIRPNVPSTLDFVAARNVLWRGRRLEIRADRNTVTVRGPGIDLRKTYDRGETIRIPA